jgi:membrane protease YdiL (CAAX protease family)
VHESERRLCMNRCSWCGKEAEENAAFCPGCGSALPVLAPAMPPPLPPFLPRPLPPLGAGRATAILLIYLAGQIGAGIAAGALAVIFAAVQGTNITDPKNVARITQSIQGPAAALAMTCGGAVMLLAAPTMIRSELTDPSPCGAAWRVGSWKHLLQGLGAGVLAGLFFAVLGGVFGEHWLRGPPGPLARMAMTPGFTRALFIGMALLLAPPFEELLFRGVLYGGYRRTLGAIRAAALTTFIFCLLHIPDAIHFPPAFIGIASLALTALWFRLRAGAIGPAVAVHFGYNGVLVLAAIISKTP